MEDKLKFYGETDLTGFWYKLCISNQNQKVEISKRISNLKGVCILFYFIFY